MSIKLNGIGIILLFLNSWSVISQSVSNISGTWYSNGIANAPARITQSGNQLSFSYNQSNSTGYFTGPNQLYAKEWNAAATIEPDGQTIIWNNQVWKRSAGQLTCPDINGTWYANSDEKATCQISQNGFNLNFSAYNSNSTGYYYEQNKIYAKEWDAYGEVSSDIKTIKWNNQTWSRSSNATENQSRGNHKYCRFELSSFYYAAQAIGSVWGRSGTEPVMPTAEAISAMEAHLATAIRVYSANDYSTFDNCLQYNLSKLRTLQSSLHTMSSVQIRHDIEFIISELQTSVTNAPFRCDHGVRPIALYVTGINLGAAQAWASAQQCRPAPMDPTVAGVIAAHLTTAANALSPYAACLEGQKSGGTMINAFDFNNFANVPLASPNSIAAHTFIVGTENQLLWAIALSPCCCDCSGNTMNPVDNGGSECDIDCKTYCKQKGYQNGSYNGKAPCMLGKVYEGGCDCKN